MATVEQNPKIDTTVQFHFSKKRENRGTPGFCSVSRRRCGHPATLRMTRLRGLRAELWSV